jgi:hypothetical protein
MKTNKDAINNREYVVNSVVKLVWSEVEDCAVKLGFFRKDSKRMLKAVNEGIEHGIELIHCRRRGAMNFNPCLSLRYPKLTLLIQQCGGPFKESDPIYIYSLNQLAYDFDKKRKISDYEIAEDSDIAGVSDIMCKDLNRYAPKFFIAQSSQEKIVSYFEQNKWAGGVFRKGFLAGLYFLCGDLKKCKDFINMWNNDASSLLEKNFYMCLFKKIDNHDTE